jgi:hypothetical protein
MQLTRERFTNWRLVATVALLVCYFASMYFVGATATILLAGFISSLIVLPTAFIKGVVIPLTSGVSCPGCGGRPLRYVGCISFGDRFYHCQECGLRCKRGSSSEPWYDASGSEDDAVYNPKAKGGPSPCSRWLPDRRDARTIVRAVGAFLAVFGWLLGCVAVGLWINKAWGPMIGSGLGFGVIAFVGGKVAASTARNRNDLWDDDLDSERSFLTTHASD